MKAPMSSTKSAAGIPRSFREPISTSSFDTFSSSAVGLFVSDIGGELVYI